MSCFWDGLRASLKVTENNKNFALFLKSKNTETNSVTWQNKTLSKKQLQENYEHVRDYSVNNINKGYLCSTADPFLFLICEIYNINIIHKYNKVNIKYITNNQNTVHYFQSNNRHFWHLTRN